MSAAPVAATERPLRIVLFGPPRAGKTALLAALAQTQQSQTGKISGRLEDPGGALEQQRHLFYDALPHSTEQETVVYRTRFVPAGPRARPVDLELIDCDGRVDLELLKNRPPLDEAD